LLVAVVERREESREIREQLRCCDWIQFPRANLRNLGGEGGREDASRIAGRGSQEPEYLPVSTSFESKLEPRSLIADLLQLNGSKKLLREKEE
jgi:hypothetical protein